MVISMNLKIISLLFLSSVAIQTNAYAGVYKCLKENNEVYYKDKPCESGQQTQKLTIRKKIKKYDDTLIQKLETYRLRKQAEFEEIQRKKDSLRMAKLKEKNRIGRINVQNKIAIVRESEAKQRKKQYVNDMKFGY